MPTFYAGQTDYIDKLNTLATANAIVGIVTSVANLDSSVATAVAGASTATTKADEAAASATSAATSAGTATTQAGIATTKAGEAATSAGTASTGATTATTQASIATTKAGEAAVSATSASTSLASVNLIFDTFDDRFLGSKTSAPTLDNGGNALVAGTVYYNSITGTVNFYNGSTWEAPAASATASASAAAASATTADTQATNAATSATNASTSATTATTQATNASTSATTATTQVGIATTKAGEAATSATNAATSATTATTQATNAASSYDAFDDRYLGSKATNPTLDNDGADILTGAIYWNTATPEMRVWNGTAWVAVQSLSSATTATTQATAAATSATNAATSDTNAASSATAAATSATTASTQATAAVASATTATAQASTATTKAGEAATSATSATTSATTASTQATNASDSATAASTSAATANTKASEAATSATNAASSATTATTQATNSASSATLAQNWATQLVTPVSGGEYSAKYWAQQAAASITGQLIYRGSWSAATAAYPSSPAIGDYYKVSVAGTTNTIVYAVNDSIIYNGTTWDKIDSTDAVTSVAGQIGAVVLTKSDVGLANVDNTSDANKPVSTAQTAAFAPIAHVGAGGAAHSNVVAAGAAGFMTGADKTKLDAITGTNTGDQTNITGNAGTANALSVGADRTKLDAVTGTNTGDETLATIKTKLGVTTLSGSNTGDQTIALTGGVTGSGTGSFAVTVATNANLTGEVTSVGNATTVTNAAVIGKVLTGYVSGSGTVDATDTILQAINKLNGNVALKGTGDVTLAGVQTLTNKTLTDPAMGNSSIRGIKTATFNAQGTSATTTGAVTIDWSAAQNFLQTEPTGAITYTFSPPPGICHLQLLVASDGTSTAQAVTFPASVKWLGAGWAGVNNKAAIINFWFDGATYWAMGVNQA